MWRQSMQMKWIDPSTLRATRCPKAVERKVANSARDISPEAMANSRCLTEPPPET